jgi:hypothetical protein
MLKLTYNRKSDKFQTVTVLGSPEGIRDLYWQLTHNYVAQDGTAIDKIIVSNLDGTIISPTDFQPHPWADATQMTRHFK